VPYFHVVYTLPSELRDIAYQNKRVVYDLLMKAAAETTLAIAADPKRLGARIGVTAVLHTWGSALTHHPHADIIVPGGCRYATQAARMRRPVSPEGGQFFISPDTEFARLCAGANGIRTLGPHKKPNRRSAPAPADRLFQSDLSGHTEPRPQILSPTTIT